MIIMTLFTRISHSLLHLFIIIFFLRFLLFCQWFVILCIWFLGEKLDFHEQLLFLHACNMRCAICDMRYAIHVSYMEDDDGPAATNWCNDRIRASKSGSDSKLEDQVFELIVLCEAILFYFWCVRLLFFCISFIVWMRRYLGYRERYSVKWSKRCGSWVPQSLSHLD